MRSARNPDDTTTRLALLAAALLAVCGGLVCRAATLPAFDEQVSELMPSGHGAVRFRSNDHGALRALQAVYAARSGLLWVSNGQPTPAALALLRTLQQADAYGLDPQDYDADGRAAIGGTLATGKALSTGGPINPGGVPRNNTMEAQRWAVFDVNLSAAALKLICDLHYGRRQWGKPTPWRREPANLRAGLPRWPIDEVPVGHVTNGVHVPSWDSAQADALWTKACGAGCWLAQPESIARGIATTATRSSGPSATRAAPRSSSMRGSVSYSS